MTRTTRKTKIARTLTALVIAATLTACATPTAPEPTVDVTVGAPTPTVTTTVEPTVEPEQTVEPEPTVEPTPTVSPVPKKAIKEGKQVGRKPAPTAKDSHVRTDELEVIARKVEAETGRRLIFLTAGGEYGADGSMVRPLFAFATFWYEPQACTPRWAETLAEVRASAEACVAGLADSDIYEIVDAT